MFQEIIRLYSYIIISSYICIYPYVYIYVNIFTFNIIYKGITLSTYE